MDSMGIDDSVCVNQSFTMDALIPAADTEPQHAAPSACAELF